MPVTARQLSLDEAEIAKMQGMENAFEHADETWKAVCMVAILDLAKSQKELAADDVWEWMESRYKDIDTHEHRAMGPMFTLAAGKDRRWIRKTERVRNSRRERQNCRPLAIWESAIYLVKE